MADDDRVGWQRIHIFISSTFNDMHGERDYLIKRVFPQLADWCEARRLRMIDIDLRWGVTEQDATRNSNVVKVCLRRIDECRPFFVCLLGQRYGWVPRPDDVSPVTFEDFPGLAKAVDEARSVTELEILHAIVRPFAEGETRQLSGQALFYIRHPASLRRLPRSPRQLWRTFSDSGESDPKSRRFLLQRRSRLRKKVIPATGRPTAVYRASWKAEEGSPELELPLRCPALLPENIDRWRGQWRDAGVSIDGLDVSERPEEAEKARRFNEGMTSGRLGDFTVDGEALGDRLLRDLQAAIEERHPGRRSQWPTDPVSLELAQQEAFHFAAAEGFIERQEDFDALQAYVSSDSDRPFVLTAPAGAGKSMLLARWIDVLLTSGTVHYRFVGASDQSTTVTSLLNLLIAELALLGRISQVAPPTPEQLRQIWPDLLAQAGAAAPLVIVIDALDQLQSGLGDLTWIPRRLPTGVKLVVSFRRDAPDAAAASERFLKDEAVMGEVRLFDAAEDRRRLVRAYLAQYLKELDDEQIEALIQAPGAVNPLFLKIALTELRVFGAFANLATKIRHDFGESPQSAFAAVLQRLERDPAYTPIEPAAAVPIVFALLSQVRHGLAADELAAMLCKAVGGDPKSKDDLQAAADTVQQFLRQTRPFLGRREGRFAFFYDTFREAATDRYVGHGERMRPPQDWHMMLADYFFSVPLWRTEAGTRSPDRRSTGELPYHLTLADDGKRLAKTLSDLDFVEAKCAAGWTYELLSDYLRVPPPLRVKAIDEFKEFVTRDAHVLAQWPELTYQQAANTVLHDVSMPDAQSAPAKAASYRKMIGLESRAWVRRLNTGPEGRARLLTLTGHQGAVTAIAVSSDGSRIVSAGVDRSLRVWDARTGSPIEVVAGLLDEKPLIAPVHGSTTVAITAGSGQILLWDYDRLQTVRELTLNGAPVASLATDWTGRWLAVARSGSASTMVIDLEDDAAHDMGSIIGNGVDAVAIDPNGRLVRAFHGRLHVDDVRGRRSLAAFERPNRVERVLFSPKGDLLASGAWGSDKIQLVNAERFDAARWFLSFQETVHDIAFRPDGEELAAAGSDGTIKIFDVASGESTALFLGHTGAVLAVAYSRDGSRLISGSADGTIRVWDSCFGRDFYKLARQRMAERVVRPGESAASAYRAVEGITHLMVTARKHREPVTGVGIAMGGKCAITASADQTVRIWDFSTGTCDRIFEGHEHEVLDLALSSGGTLAASSDRAPTIKVWNLETQSEQASLAADSVQGEGTARLGLEGLFREVTRPKIPIAFVGDGLLASADILDPTIKIWDAATLAAQSSLTGHRQPVQAMIAAADGRHLVSASGDGSVIAWDVPARRSIAIAEGFASSARLPGQANALTLLADDHVACAWNDGTLRILEPSTLQVVRTLRGNAGAISTLVAAGDLIGVTRSAPEGTVVDLWSGGSSEPVYSRTFPTPQVALALELGGDRFATAGPAETLCVWHIGCAQPVHRFPAVANCLAFRSGRIVAGNDIGDVFLLEIMR